MEVAIRVEETLVAGSEPSVHKGSVVCLGIIFISPKHIRALDRDFAALVGPQMIAFRVHDADAQTGAHAYRSCLSMPRRQRIRSHLMRGLGHSIGFHEGYAEESLDFVNQFRRQRRAARADETRRG